MTKTENLTFIYNPLDWTLGPIGPLLHPQHYP